MPRKTKKQKRKAEERRQEAFSKPQKGTLVKGEFEFSPAEFSRHKRVRKTAKKSDKSPLFVNTSIVARDLARTILIALGIFSLEIVVYLVWFK